MATGNMVTRLSIVMFQWVIGSGIAIDELNCIHCTVEPSYSKPWYIDILETTCSPNDKGIHVIYSWYSKHTDAVNILPFDRRYCKGVLLYTQIDVSVHICLCNTCIHILSTISWGEAGVNVRIKWNAHIAVWNRYFIVMIWPVGLLATNWCQLEFKLAAIGNKF